MIQITAKTTTGDSLDIYVDKNIEITSTKSDGSVFVLSVTPSEWDLINQFVFDQTRKKP